MTPKEKAEKLYRMFSLGGWGKEHATNCVDEILEIFEGLHKPEYCAFDAIGERQYKFDGEYSEHMTGYDMVEYWEEVKKALQQY